MKLNRLNHKQLNHVLFNESFEAETDGQVSVRFAEILPTLANAFQNGFQWIRDFDDDQIQIPSDLMDLIQRVKQADAELHNQSA